MANDATSERLWILDTDAVITAVGTPVKVRKLYYVPVAADNAATIQEYSNTGVLRAAAHIQAGATDASPVEQDFGPEGRLMNGFKLSAITAGTLYVYLGTG